MAKPVEAPLEESIMPINELRWHVVLREARQFNPKEFRILVSPPVVELLLAEECKHLAGLSDFIGKPISLRRDGAMRQEQYDIVLL